MQTNRFKKQIVIVSISFFILAVAVVIKLAIHEKWQSDQLRQQNEIIDSLSKNISENELKISQLQNQIDKLNIKVEYSDNAFNYLAIGNSITLHAVTDYWWNEVGMAATEADKDYVHLISNYLKDQYGDVCCYSTNFSLWERQSHDRAETYDDIDKFLSMKLNLVTIQLGENVDDPTTFESDLEELIEYVQKKAPKAEILVIDNFWDDEKIESMKIEASNNTNVKFISLDEIKNKPEYQCGLGTIVFDKAGNEHTVEHEGVARHPNNDGMKYIADKIIESLNKQNGYQQ